MKRLTPVTGIIFLLLFMGLYLGIQMAVESGFGRSRLERVRPDEQGLVRIDVGEFEPLEVRFYRFLNPANQEVEFLVGLDEHGVVQVGFNANEAHYKTRRGFSAQNGWIIDNKCETTTRLSTVNTGGGGCRPVAVTHRVVGDELQIREQDLLAGWRYFR
ncbi:MAG: Fe-S-containing protein [Acidobacteriota bacterium]|nr:Fe-S-containing protein [Acidobacteriota bacterium]